MSDQPTIINLTKPDKDIPRPFSTFMKRLALILRTSYGRYEREFVFDLKNKDGQRIH